MRTREGPIARHYCDECRHWRLERDVCPESEEVSYDRYCDHPAAGGRYIGSLNCTPNWCPVLAVRDPLPAGQPREGEGRTQ